VIQNERYRTVPSDLCLSARGYYGEPAAPIVPNVNARILQGEDPTPIDPTENYLEPVVSRARKEAGASLSDEELLLTLFFSRPTLDKFRKNRRAIEFPAVKPPLTALIQEIGKRPQMRKFCFQKGPLKLEQTW